MGHVSLLKAKKKKRRKKKKRDPNRPKKPMQAFFMYSRDNKDEMKKEYPDLKHTEIMKKLGEVWNGLSEKKKEPYYKEAQKLKKKYDKEMIKYNENLKKNPLPPPSSSDSDSDSDGEKKEKEEEKKEKRSKCS